MPSLKALIFRLTSLLLLIGLAIFTACDPSSTITDDLHPCDNTSIVVAGKFVALDAGVSVDGIPFEIQYIENPGWFGPITKIVKARGNSAADGSYTACITPLDGNYFHLIPLTPTDVATFCGDMEFETSRNTENDTIFLTNYVRSLVSCELTLKNHHDLPLAQEATMHISWSANDTLHQHCTYSGSAKLGRKAKQRSQMVYLPAGTAVTLQMLKTTKDHPDRTSEKTVYSMLGNPMRVDLEW